MSQFGKTLFGGSRFIFWSLAPFLLLFALGLPFWITQWTLKTLAFVVVLESLMLLLLPALYAPQRFHWAVRMITALVFCLCLAYAISEIWFSESPVKTDGQAQASAENAVTTLTTLGLPCLWFAVFGRWRLSHKKRSAVARKIKIPRIDI